MWLKEGERNTRFFHLSTIQYCLQNKITTLKDNTSEILNKHEDLKYEMVSYFKTLLTKPEPRRDAVIHKITQRIPSLVTLKQNNMLMCLVKRTEVEEVIKKMEEGNVLEGFTTNLFHYCWDIIKEEAFQIV